MAIYSTYSCPKCNKTIEWLVPYGSKGIGSPLRSCPKCNTKIDARPLLNEWELLNSAEQQEMHSIVRATARNGGGIWGFIVSLLGLMWLLGTNSVASFCMALIFAVFVAFVSYRLHLSRVTIKFDNMVKESQQRTSDPQYVKTLDEHGISKSKDNPVIQSEERRKERNRDLWNS